MAVEQIAARHARQRIAVAKRTAVRLAALWRRIDPGSIAVSWQALLSLALVELSTAQAAVAHAADPYLEATTGEIGSAVVPTAFAGIASDGRPLASLLFVPAIHALEHIGAGVAPARALAGGLFELDMMARTQVADAGRMADQVALTARPKVAGYRRMLVGKSCSRCVILAGRWYRYNVGFKRHFRCDCVHIPTAEALDDATTSPRKYFDSLSTAEQDKAFTKAGAEAIRQGADPAQVVNARRGMQTASVFGRDVLITTDGTTTRGLAGARLGARESGVKVGGQRYRFARPPRLMPEQILRDARDRDDAIRLLRRFGYIR